jgi:DNA-directed RNA polymerase subunit N (RpoN/RPB10)
MLYVTCPTCGTFLGNKNKEFEDKKKIICDNPNHTDEKKSELISKLLNDLNLKRYCCKMRMMTYKDIVYEILPIPK